MPTTIKIFWPSSTLTSSKDRWIGAYSIGLTIPGKLGCLFKKKKDSVILYQNCTMNEIWVLILVFCNFFRKLVYAKHSHKELSRMFSQKIYDFLMWISLIRTFEWTYLRGCYESAPWYQNIDPSQKNEILRGNPSKWEQCSLKWVYWMMPLKCMIHLLYRAERSEES